MLDKKTLDDEIIEKVTELAENGTLITSKHDPDHLTQHSSNRSVASHETKQSLPDAIKADEFDFDLYSRTDGIHPEFYMTMTPTPDCRINIAASGVVVHTPVSVLDRLVVVDGPKQGPHTFGEDATNIQSMVNDGTLSFERRLQRTKQGREKK